MGNLPKATQASGRRIQLRALWLQNVFFLLLNHILSLEFIFTLFFKWMYLFIIFFFFFFFFFFLPFRATSSVYGSPQARGHVGTVVASLHHSHSNAWSLTHWARPRIEPTSLWILVRVVPTEPQNGNSCLCSLLLYWKVFPECTECSINNFSVNVVVVD